MQWTLTSVIILAATTASAQAPFEAADRVLAAAKLAHPAHAFAYAVVPRKGESTIRTVGRLDEHQPFETWARVPLGRLTSILLDYALGAASLDGKLDWGDLVTGALPNLDPSLNQLTIGAIHQGGSTVLPHYFRFVSEPSDARALEEVLREHAFAGPASAPVPAPDMLSTAILQAVLRKRTGRAWRASLEWTSRVLSLPSLRDASAPGPSIGVVTGRKRDGTNYPIRLAEVAAYGNATSNLDDLASFARHCLVAGYPAAEDVERLAVTPLTRRFSTSLDSEYGVSVDRFVAGFCGSVVHLELIPVADLALVVFGNLESAWVRGIRDALVHEICSKDIQAAPLGVALRGGFNFGAVGVTQQPDWPVGPFRAQLDVHGKTVTFELELDAGRVLLTISGMRAGVTVGRAEGDIIRARVSLFEGSRSSDETRVDITLGIDGDDLDGVATLAGPTRNEIQVERLPVRIRFESRFVGPGQTEPGEDRK